MAKINDTSIPEGYKRCCYGDECVHPDGPVLPSSNEYFSKHPRSADRLQRQCKTCDKDRKRKRQQDEDWKLHRNAYKREYRKTDRSKKHMYAYKQTQKYKADQKRYRNTERGHAVINSASQRRRARKQGLEYTFSAEAWQYALSYFNGCCAVCGRQLNDLFGEHTTAADHWIPLSSPECPGTIPTNIVPLCHGVGGCNNSKYDKEPFEWLVSRFGKRKATKIHQRIQEYFATLVAA